MVREQKRISGPLLNRIDVHVEVPRANSAKLSGTHQGEPSAAVREQIDPPPAGDARTIRAA